MPKTFDTSELDALAASFGAAPAEIITAVRPVAARAGVAMKKDLQAAAKGHRHLPGLERFVEYDVDETPTSVTVEVGFRKEGQGNLANIAAFGSVNNAPVLDITAPLRDEVPNFIRWAAKAAAEVL